MDASANIEAFVLAGGKSSRMGKDKGLLPLKGRPMISYVLKALNEMALPVRIIANQSGYENFGYQVLQDEIPGNGPLGGLYTAFQHTTADHVLLLGCDMPLVNSEALCMLLNSAGAAHITAASKEGQVNPLFAIYPKDFAGELKERMDRGDLKMSDFILKTSHILVTSIGEKLPWALQNINNKHELQEVEEKWTHLL